MKHELAHRPPTLPSAPEPTLARLATLDPLLDRQLTCACRRVGDPAGYCTQVALFAALGAHDEDTFWHACDQRAAELATQYGVEILLAQEGSQVRIRIERFESASSPVADNAAQSSSVRRHWSFLPCWWRARGRVVEPRREQRLPTTTPVAKTMRVDQETRR